MPGKISAVQQKLIDLLNADPFFKEGATVHVPIILKKLGDVEAQIDESLAQLNVGLVIILRSARLLESESFELVLVCQFALSAVTNPIAKDDGSPDAYDIVEKAALLLNGHSNGIDPDSRFFVDQNAIGPLPPAPKKAFLDIQLLLVNTTILLT